MNAVIFANADIRDYSVCNKYLERSDVVICCDGGMRHTKAMGIRPDYILGDFDSVAPDVLQYYKDIQVPVKQFPTKKNETDMELGVGYALELGATDITIFGGIGSRLDHTLANAFFLISIKKRGASARLVNENNCAEICFGELKVCGKAGDTVSIIPMTPKVIGVTLTGFEYPLCDFEASCDSPRCVSNVLLGNVGVIRFKEGIALVIQAKD